MVSIDNLMSELDERTISKKVDLNEGFEIPRVRGFKGSSKIIKR